eukprot:11545889-Alexandrium_andersonii.AAC.1
MVQQALFVEVFSGEGHLCAAAARAGFTAVPWDIVLGDQYDLLHQRNRGNLIRLCLAASYVHMGV